jgi:hypothetical protein
MAFEYTYVAVAVNDWTSKSQKNVTPQTVMGLKTGAPLCSGAISGEIGDLGQILASCQWSLPIIPTAMSRKSLLSNRAHCPCFQNIPEQQMSSRTYLRSSAVPSLLGPKFPY